MTSFLSGRSNIRENKYPQKSWDSSKKNTKYNTQENMLNLLRSKQI